MTIDAIESEVVSLHEFFAAWFRGSLPLEAFDQFERALDEDFLIVTPAGRAIGREAILDAVRDARGGDPGARIWIRDVQLRRHLGDVVVATYEEWQQSGAEPPRGRLSTVVFRRDANAAHGMRWAHVHETWLPPEQ